MENSKKTLIGVSSIFTGLLIIAYIRFVGILPLMFKYDWFLGVLVILLTITDVLGWVFMLLKFEDPNFDWIRKVCIISAVAASSILLAYGSQKRVDKIDKIAPVVYVNPIK